MFHEILLKEERFTKVVMEHFYYFLDIYYSPYVLCFHIFILDLEPIELGQKCGGENFRLIILENTPRCQDTLTLSSSRG